MTIEETKKVMAYVASAYPRYFANVTRESAERQAIPWFDALGEYSAGAVMTGVKSYISADSSGFPPTPGQIIHYIHFTGNPADHSGTEAWALVRKAVNCPWDQMEASFMTLPETVRKAVGNAASLKELAMMDTQKFETVAQSNFLRMYDAVQKREATERKVPSAAIAARERINAELEMRHRKAFGLPDQGGTMAGEQKAIEADKEKQDAVPAPADRLKITSVELSRYINGRRMPKAPLIFQMAKELDCAADELMGIEEPAQADEEPNEPTFQDAIKWFKSRAQSATLPGARKMFQIAVTALEKQEKDKWIPCSERLPEEYGEYRITWKESGSDKTFIADSEFEPSLEWDNAHDRFDGEWLLEDHIKAYPDVEVVAWKPIGEPYKGEK